jgi:hypothetical protein
LNNKNIKPIEYEITLPEIIEFLKESWKQIVLGGVVGGAIGVSVALNKPQIYEATAAIHGGKVANTEVEPAAILYEKLQMPKYFTSETFISCEIDKSPEPGKLIANELNSRFSNSASIIYISYKSRNIVVAKKCLESVLNDIRKNQNNEFQYILKEKKIYLAALKQNLMSAKKNAKELLNFTKNLSTSDSQLSASALLFVTSINMSNEINVLQTQINSLEVSLLEPQTKEAFFLVPVYGPSILDQKKSLKVASSIIGGMVLVIGFLMARRGWAKINESKKDL